MQTMKSYAIITPFQVSLYCFKKEADNVCVIRCIFHASAGSCSLVSLNVAVLE